MKPKQQLTESELNQLLLVKSMLTFVNSQEPINQTEINFFHILWDQLNEQTLTTCLVKLLPNKTSDPQYPRKMKTLVKEVKNQKSIDISEQIRIDEVLNSHRSRNLVQHSGNSILRSDFNKYKNYSELFINFIIETVFEVKLQFIRNTYLIGNNSMREAVDMAYDALENSKIPEALVIAKRILNKVLIKFSNSKSFGNSNYVSISKLNRTYHTSSTTHFSNHRFAHMDQSVEKIRNQIQSLEKGLSKIVQELKTQLSDIADINRILLKNFSELNRIQIGAVLSSSYRKFYEVYDNLEIVQMYIGGCSIKKSKLPSQIDTLSILDELAIIVHNAENALGDIELDNIKMEKFEIKLF